MLDSIYLSWLGIIYLIMLFIPNFFWTKHQPFDYDAKSENLILLILERIGQGLVTCFAIISFQKIIWQWDILLIIATIAMFLYEGYWIRYFHSDCTLQDFYTSFLKIPLAGATLPVLAFLCLGIYERHILLVISTIILEIGHIGIHYEHFRKINA